MVSWFIRFWPLYNIMGITNLRSKVKLYWKFGIVKRKLGLSYPRPQITFHTSKHINNYKGRGVLIVSFQLKNVVPKIRDYPILGPLVGGSGLWPWFHVELEPKSNWESKNVALTFDLRVDCYDQNEATLSTGSKRRLDMDEARERNCGVMKWLLWFLYLMNRKIFHINNGYDQR